MKNDIIDVMEACIDGTLDKVDLQFEDNAAVCVVLASDGYPVSYEKGYPIHGLEKFDGKDDYFVFHAGTKFDGDQIVTNGGRVLGGNPGAGTCPRQRQIRSGSYTFSVVSD